MRLHLPRLLLPLLFLLSLTACPGSSVLEEGCETVGCASTERCNPDTHACEPLPACTSASGCKQGEECLGGVCSSCQGNIQCTGALGTCDPRTLECVGCTADAQCVAATPHCSSGGACLECTTDSHCPGGKCFRGWCGQCRLHSDCPSDQTCEGGQCRTSCYMDAQCAAGTPHCVDGGCLACRHDADCAAGLGCYEGTCRTPYPGDTCRSALPLALGGGSAVVEGSIPFGYEAKTSPYSSEIFTDVYYAVDIIQEGFLDLALTPRGLSASVSVSVLTGDCGALHEMASAPRTLGGVFVVPGRYLVRIAESTYSLMDSFRLSVRFTPGSRGAGNHCLKPIALSVGQPGGSATALTASFAGLVPVSPDLCEDDTSTARPDLVYSFTLAERSAVNVRATPESPADRLDLRLKRSCWEGDETCSYDSAPGAVGLRRGPLEPGDYVVVLRSRSGSSPVALEVEVVPWATNSTCEMALPVTFDATGTAVVQGNTDYADAGIGGCSGGWGSRVQHYRVSTVGLGRRSLVAQVQTQSGTGGTVALHPTCRTEQNVQAAYCAGTGMNRVNDLPEGSYDLTVTSAGAFTLTLTLGEPYPRPANDTCSAPRALTLAGDRTFSVTGDTRGATAFINSRCGTDNWGTTSRDVVFSVPGTGRGRLYATLHPTSAGYNPALMLSDYCSTGVNACADQSGPGGDESTSMRFWARSSSEVPLLWVTARDGSEGTFSLSGHFEPAPANDACAGATPLSQDSLGSGSVTGDIGLAFPDSDDRCTSTGSALYYEFTAVKNASYRVRLVPTGFDAQLTVFDTCGGGSCMAGPANAAGMGGAEELTVTTGSSGGAFRLGVHSALVEDAGAFTLSVTRL